MKTGAAVKPVAGVNVEWTATVLPLRRYRDIPAFLSLSTRVAKQVKRSDGAVRYALNTDLRRRRFWTVSAWRDRAAMRAFVQAEPHATAVKKFAGWAADGAAFVEWTGPDKKVDWKEVLQKLETPTFRYQKK